MRACGGGGVGGSRESNACASLLGGGAKIMVIESQVFFLKAFVHRFQ